VAIWAGSRARSEGRVMRIIYETKDYRITERADEHVSVEDLKGDVFNPKVNPEMDPTQLAAEERAFEELVAREGVYGYALERRCGECGAWQHVDSCWGFVGAYTPTEDVFNHYIVDELKGQIPNKRTEE
jgi:hypothetical protein